jgi:membrane carboxypeptidase/penicillin-binding protein
MPWTSLHWTILALLCLLAAAIVVIIRLLDGRDEYVPTRAQRRAWKRDRLVLPRANRRRA